MIKNRCAKIQLAYNKCFVDAGPNYQKKICVLIAHVSAFKQIMLIQKLNLGTHVTLRDHQ